MDTQQPADPSESARATLADSILARTRWVQRALSPWARQWLVSTGAPTRGTPTRGPILPFAFTTGAAQQTLSRVQLQYQSFLNQAVPGDLHGLPLAGTVLPPTQVTPDETVPVQATGPYSHAFNSLEEFLAALEASKTREQTAASAPAPTPAPSAKPAPRRAQGPYSRAFRSMEEFVKAVEEAKARNYEPPAEEAVPAPTPREIGPYAHAFKSFEEFAKAVEESRQQWGSATPQETKPSAPPAPTGKIRPISRIEELPTRGVSAWSDTTETTLPQPEAAEFPEQLPPTRSATEPLPSQVDITAPVDSSAPAVPAQPTIIPPFSPAKARAGRSPQAAGSPAQRRSDIQAEAPTSTSAESALAFASAAPPIKSATIAAETIDEGPESLAESPAASEDAAVESISSAVSIEPKAVVEAAPFEMPSNEAATPTRSSVRPQRPVVEPVSTTPRVKPTAQPASSGMVTSNATSSVAPAIRRAIAEETVADESILIGEAAPAVDAVQRQVATSELDQPVHPIDQAVSDQAASSAVTEASTPVLQREVSESAAPAIDEEELQRQPLSAVPAVQRTADKAASVTPQTVQRQAAADEEELQRKPMLEVQTLLAERPTVQRKVEDKPLATPARVQRQADEPSATTSAEEAIQRLPTPEVASVHTEMPMVQRQAGAAAERASDEEDLQRKPISETTAAHVELPLVQRRVVTPPATTLPAVQRQTIEPVASIENEAAAQSPTTAEAIPAHVEVPSVQRQASVGDEEELQRQPTSSAVPDRTDMPFVQRKTATVPSVQREASEAAISVENEEDLQRKPTAEVQATQAETPNVQRSVDSAPSIAPLPVPRLTSESDSALPDVEEAEIQRTALPDVGSIRAEMPLVQRKIDSQPSSTSPIVQRQASEPAAAIEDEEELQRSSTLDAAPIQTEMPLVQRHASESADSAPLEEEIQRATTSEVASAPTEPVAIQRRAQDTESRAPVQSPKAALQDHEATPTTSTAAARLEMPLVQRQTTSPAPREEVSTQRRVSEPVLEPAPSNIAERILARVAHHEQVVTQRLPDLPLHQPVVQPVNAPAAKTVTLTPTPEIAPALAVPVSPPAITTTVQRTSEPVIQRTPVEVTTATAESGTLQRVETAPAEAITPESTAAPDLDSLARQVYPIIKRLLAIERERRSSR